MCANKLTGVAGTKKHWLLRAGTVERFINTLYLITERVTHSTHTYTRTQLKKKALFTQRRGAGQKMLLVSDSEKDEQKVALSVCCCF